MRCRTRDLSLEGMYIETGTIPVPLEATLEVDCIVPDATTGPHVHRIRATVVRNGPTGIGVMFRDFGPGISRFLQQTYHRPFAP
jgi:hypothetical protein